MSQLTKQILLSLFYIALIVWGAYTLWVVRYTLTYILISGVISVMAKPLVDLLSGERWPKVKINRNFAAALTLIILLLTVFTLFRLFLPALMHELRVLADVDYESLYHEVLLEWERLQAFLGLETQAASQADLLKNAKFRPGIAEVLSIENVSDTFAGLIGGLGNLAFAVFSILFISFFFIREKHLFRNIIMAFVPDAYEGRVNKVSPRLRSNLSRYFVGLFIQITIITTLVSLGLKIAGFHNTIVIGFFAGLINIIPYLGPIIGVTFGLILGLAQTLSMSNMEIGTATVIILSIFAVVQLIDNFFTQPLVFSTSIRAHPLEIFLVISFAASLAGIAGMIVAVPLYSVLRLLAAEFLPHLKPVRKLTAEKEESAD